VGRLLLDWEPDIGVRTNDGETALQVQARERQDTMVRLLLNWGADVDAKDTVDFKKKVRLKALKKRHDTEKKQTG
jgi:hypothetical protein